MVGKTTTSRRTSSWRSTSCARDCARLMRTERVALRSSSSFSCSLLFGGPVQSSQPLWELWVICFPAQETGVPKLWTCFWMCFFVHLNGLPPKWNRFLFGLVEKEKENPEVPLLSSPQPRETHFLWLKVSCLKQAREIELEPCHAV